MPRSAARKAEESTTEETRTEEEAAPSYDLEAVDDDLRSRLNVWGNSTLLLLGQIENKYPQWHLMLSDMFQIIKDSVEVMGQ